MYNTDQPAGTRRWLRRLMALPLVPVARIPAVFVLPKQVHALNQLVVGAPWTTTSDGRQLILADDGVDDKILVLCTPENLHRCCTICSSINFFRCSGRNAGCNAACMQAALRPSLALAYLSFYM